MRKGYIVISQSGSIISKCIQVKTKKDFNHCSFSLDPNISVMYSMGRIFPNNPLIGGLVAEKPNYGTYKKFYNTVCVVIEIPLNDNQYLQIQSELLEMYSDKRSYSYNYAGLLLGAFGINVKREDAFMCSEFVRHILEAGQVDVSFLPAIPHPMDFLNIQNGKVVYEGRFNDLGKKSLLSSNFGRIV